jgi:hypothetical protein
MSMTLSSMRIAMEMVLRSLAWSIWPSSVRWRSQVHRAQVADRGFGVAGVERDLGAQVGRVHDAGMLLGRADIAGVLEGDPGMARLEQHRQHLAPQVGGRQGATGLDLATGCALFVGDVGAFELHAELVMQVGHAGGREQGPGALLHDAAHEQVGDPVGGVHVVRTAPVVAGVLAQLEELFQVEVPGFQIGADRALALAALVDRDRGVVDHLQEGNHALRFAVGALDVRAQGTHTGPVVAQSAGELGQQGVFLDRLVDAVQVVGHGGEVTRGQLRTQRAAVEQRRRARHEVERGQDLVELDGPRLAVDLVERQAHGHPHEESLRQFDAAFVDMQEITVVQGLQAEVVELQVALCLEGAAQALEVELQQFFVQQFVVDTLADELREIVDIGLAHAGLGHITAEHFLGDGVEQQARGGVGVVGVFLDQGAGSQHRGLVDLVHGNTVVQVAQGFGQDRIGADIGAQAFTGRIDQALEPCHVQHHAAPAVDHMQRRRLGCRLFLLAGALLGAFLAVQHIGTGDLVVPPAHQAELDVILHVFDVKGAATRARTHQRPDHRLGQAVHHLAHTRRGSTLGAMDRQEGLHHGHGDLVGLERHDRPVAADDLVLAQGNGCCSATRIDRLRRSGARLIGVGGGHGNLHLFLVSDKRVVGIFWVGGTRLEGFETGGRCGQRTLYMGYGTNTSHYR